MLSPLSEADGRIGSSVATDTQSKAAQELVRLPSYFTSRRENGIRDLNKSQSACSTCRSKRQAETSGPAGKETRAVRVCFSGCRVPEGRKKGGKAHQVWRVAFVLVTFMNGR